MDAKEIRAELDSFLGGVVVCGTWHYTQYGMTCNHVDGSCCEEEFNSVEEAAKSVEFMSGGDLSSVRVAD